MTVLPFGTRVEETRWNSPNFTPAADCPRVFGRPRTQNRITLHHWGHEGQRFDDVANFLSRPNGNTSAHFVVEGGRVACLVSPEHAAWHSGSPIGNASSIGIECRPEMSEEDLNTLVELIIWLEAVYGHQEIWLHKEWSTTACPGKYEDVRQEIVNRVNQAQESRGDAETPSKEAIRAALLSIKESVEKIEGEL